MMPHSFSVRLEPDDARWIRARAAVMAVHESNFHAPCCEACGKEWGKTVPTAESDPFVTVLTELHVQPPLGEVLLERVAAVAKRRSSVLLDAQTPGPRYPERIE